MADYSKFIEEQIKSGATLIIEDPEEYFGHTQISNIILWNSNLSHIEIRVYMVIKSFAYGNKIHCWPGQNTIAKIIGVRREAVCNAIAGLRQKGLLQVVRRGLQKTNIYIIKKVTSKMVEEHQKLLIELEINKPAIPVKSIDVRPTAHQDKATIPVKSTDVRKIAHQDMRPTAHEENNTNNTNVVVVQDDNKNLDKSENEEIVFDQKQLCETQAATSPEAAPIPLADINRVVDAVKDVTGCVIKQQDAESLLSRWPVDYVLDKINNVVAGSKIDQSVIGWIIRCCERDWGKVKPKIVKLENKSYKEEVDNNYSSAAAATKKSMIMDYLQQIG